LKLGEEIDKDITISTTVLLYDEAMIKKTVDGEELGIKVRGECQHSVRFADDKAILYSTAATDFDDQIK